MQDNLDSFSSYLKLINFIARIGILNQVISFEKRRFFNCEKTKNILT